MLSSGSLCQLWMLVSLVCLSTSLRVPFLSSKRPVVPRMFSAKRESPSAERNKEFIYECLKSLLPKRGSVLETAAGAGVHTAYLVPRMTSDVQYYPTDPEASSLASIEAYMNELDKSSCAKVQTPLKMTFHEGGVMESATDEAIPNHLDLIININMIHISPWSATMGLMRTASQKLSTGRHLFVYGPYRVNGNMVESNVNFDLWLKDKDPCFGVRDLEDVVQVADENGLELVRKMEMPANNLSLIFRKR